MNEFKNEVCKKIKDMRLSKNLSQGRFGQKIGVSGKTISAYETGRALPSLKILETISEVYDTAIFHVKSGKKDELRTQLQQIKQAIVDLERLLLSSD
jgi:repressor LexA